jgi:hypothetical protein
MLSFWVKKAESEIMMSPMQLPIYKEGNDNVVELIKSYLGPEHSPKQYRSLVVSGMDLDNGRRGTGIKCQRLLRMRVFSVEKCKPKSVHHLAESRHGQWCWTGRSEQD